MLYKVFYADERGRWFLYTKRRRYVHVRSDIAALRAMRPGCGYRVVATAGEK